MRKHLAAAILIAITTSTGFLVESIYPLGDIRWFYVIVACSVGLILLYLPEIAIRPVKRCVKKWTPLFDMTIERAIAHVRSCQPDQYTPEYLPTLEKKIAEAIYEEACRSHVRVCGTPKGKLKAQRIQPKELKRLGIHCGVMPGGYRWILAPDDQMANEELFDGMIDFYSGLKVDSRDIYTLWPTVAPPDWDERGD